MRRRVIKARRVVVFVSAVIMIHLAAFESADAGVDEIDFRQLLLAAKATIDRVRSGRGIARATRQLLRQPGG